MNDYRCGYKAWSGNAPGMDDDWRAATMKGNIRKVDIRQDEHQYHDAEHAQQGDQY